MEPSLNHRRRDARGPAQLDGRYRALDEYVVNVRGGMACDAYVGRRTRTHAASVWGNPYLLRSNSAKARLESVADYAEFLLRGPLPDPVDALAERRLGCWCAPALCHAHVLVALANPALADAAEFATTLRKAATAEPYRLLVTGSRSWTDETVIGQELHRVWTQWGRPQDAVLVVGDADGADRLAARCWQRAGLEVELHRADWDVHGRRAGMIRNAEMVDSGVDFCVAFSVDDSRGTAHCLNAATRSLVPTRVLRR